MDAKLLRLEKKLNIMEESTNTSINLLTKEINNVKELIRSSNSFIKERLSETQEKIERSNEQKLGEFNKNINKKILDLQNNLELDIKHKITMLKSEFNSERNLIYQDIKNIQDKLESTTEASDGDIKEELLELKSDVSILTKKIKKMELITNDISEFIDIS